MALGLGLAAAPAAADPCITDFPMAEDVAVASGAVTFCDARSKKKKSCFARELATGKTSSAPRPEPAAAPVTVEIDGKRAKVCKGTACKPLAPKAPVDDTLAMRGVVNAAGTLVALINTTQVETFDAATGKRLAGFAAGKSTCTYVRFLGDTLHVRNLDCGTDSGTSWLATRTGAKLAIVGGDKPIDAMISLALDGTRAAFAATTGDVLVVQDVATGKVEKRIALGAAAADSRPVPAGDAKQLAIVFGGARRGDIAVVDLATDKVTAHAATRCP